MRNCILTPVVVFRWGISKSMGHGGKDEPACPFSLRTCHYKNLILSHSLFFLFSRFLLILPSKLKTSSQAVSKVNNRSSYVANISPRVIQLGQEVVMLPLWNVFMFTSCRACLLTCIVHNFLQSIVCWLSRTSVYACVCVTWWVFAKRTLEYIRILGLTIGETIILFVVTSWHLRNACPVVQYSTGWEGTLLKRLHRQGLSPSACAYCMGTPGLGPLVLAHTGF